MHKLILLSLAIVVVAAPAMAEQVWNGPSILFSRADYVDGTLAANQDQITPNVWITRMTGGGSLWNSKTDVLATHTDCLGPAPGDTEWAFGSIANYASLTYGPFLSGTFANCGPPYLILNNPGVVHLISEDIYIPITFVTWQPGGTGGFSYTRGTPAVVPTEQTTWGGIKALYR